ncbi:hypothetical protein K440DRAFT_32483 [Wilcoxina mikolae CBS 423.85]|nr:hypothetical protein K440DRAFT_32483 [Wilcoxina mikolae CBS 423.85]
MEIAELVVETISRQQRNRFPLPNAPGAPAFRERDVTTFLHKYESLAAFTATDVTESSVIAMFPYYCMQGPQVREKIMMMRGYTDRNWAALKKEMLVAFRYADSRPDSLVHTRRYLENLCADFAGRDDTEGLKNFFRTYDHISGVVTERGMMCEYERTEMLLRVLPKRLWRKAVTKLGMHPLEPSTFDYGKLHSWITAKITAAEALAMFEFVAPKSPAPTDMTAATPTASTAPTTSPAPTASTASTPPARTHTARQGTIRAGPTVRLGIIRVEPPQGQKVRRHHYVPPAPVRPHRSESTVTCRREPTPSNRPKPGQLRSQEPVTPNRQETVKLPRSDPIVLSRDQPAPSNRQMPAQPPQKPEPAPLEPVQPQRSEPESFPSNRRESVQPQQLDHPPCHYCANNEHNLRKCVELRMDLKKGIVSINNRDRLVLGTAGAEIPMAPAARDYRTIRDYARAGAPILSAPAPVPTPLPPSPIPAPRARSPPPPPPLPPGKLSRTSTPLLSPEQLTQLMREVTEHFAQSRRHEVVQEPPPPPAELSRISVPLQSPEQLTQLVQEVTEHFAQPRPRQTAHPSPAARKARKLEQQRSICV